MLSGMSESDYTPIACALHDRYEIAIMHRQVLHIEWLDASGESHMADVMPLDIKVSQGEEFLVARPVSADDDDEPYEIRLDRVRLCEK
jgi:transcriptional antiterminator Rof (Rho-off)